MCYNFEEKTHFLLVLCKKSDKLTHSFQSTFYIPPENIRKPYGHLMFSGGKESAVGTNGLIHTAYLSNSLVHDSNIKTVSLTNPGLTF